MYVLTQYVAGVGAYKYWRVETTWKLPICTSPFFARARPLGMPGQPFRDPLKYVSVMPSSASLVSTRVSPHKPRVELPPSPRALRCPHSVRRLVRRAGAWGDGSRVLQQRRARPCILVRNSPLLELQSCSALGEMDPEEWYLRLPLIDRVFAVGIKPWPWYHHRGLHFAAGPWARPQVVFWFCHNQRVADSRAEGRAGAVRGWNRRCKTR